MLLFRKIPKTLLVLVMALSLVTGCKPAEEGDGSDDCKNKSKEKGISSLFGLGGKDKCQGGDDDDDPTPPKPVDPLPSLPGRVCTIDKHTQNKEEQVVKKVDILFVMDHSGSMADDWARVANNVQNLVKELPKDIDIRYAVLLANGSSWKGRLYAPKKIPTVLSNQAMKIQEISNNLHKIFTEGMKVSDGNTGGEASFLSLYHAVTTEARDNQNLGFFRPDAALSVLFMSDEHEIGSPFPNPQAPGLPPRCDAAWEDNAKKIHYDNKGVNLNSLFNALAKFKGDMPVVTHAFVNITKEDLFKRNSKNAKCLYDSLGYGYFEAVNLTKGVLFSIQEDKAEGMARCGRVIKERLQIIKDFPLSKPADKVDPDSILADVDGAVVPHDYRAASNNVHLDYAGVFGSQIQIRHCEPIQRQEWSIQDFSGQAGQYAVSLSWRTPEYATEGKVVYGTSATALTSTARVSGRNTNHAVSVEGLVPNTVYYFQAVSSDEYGLEKRSGVISLRTLPDWAVTGVAAQASRNTANISWKTDEYATKGKVFYGTAADALVNESPETAAAHAHEVRLEGLSAGTTYYYQCRSRDEYGLEKRSAVQTIATLTDWGIVGFKGEASRHGASLLWETPEYDTQGKILWGTSPSALSQQAVSAGSRSHSVALSGLAAGTTYYFQAVNVDNLGAEKRSGVISLTTITDWNIAGFAGTSTKNSVTLSWRTPDYSTSGLVRWGSTAEALTGRVASLAQGTDHAVTVSGLAPDTVYYFQAVSSDDLGSTKASAVVAVRTQPEPVVEPDLPDWTLTDFTGHADKTHVTIGWKTAEYATSGKVLFGTSESNLSGELSEASPVKDHSVLVDGLTPDTIYYFQAVSRDEYGQEKKSAVTAVRTLAEDPQDPPPVGNWEVRGFDAITTATSADVIWQTRGAMTRATIKVGLAPDNLTHMSVAVEDAAETHLVPVTGLSPDTTYYLQVVAVDSTGRTVESVVIMKRTKAQ